MRTHIAITSPCGSVTTTATRLARMFPGTEGYACRTNDWRHTSGEPLLFRLTHLQVLRLMQSDGVTVSRTHG
jgi:hypothetical protein